MKIPERDKAFLVALMGWLEKVKKAHDISNKDEARLRVENFALNVFDTADQQDRAGTADMKTVRAFQAAACFFEVCKLFGDLSSDIQEKHKYSQWKAVDIAKAIREGRKPIPGGINEDPELQGGGGQADAGPGQAGGFDNHGNAAGGAGGGGGGGGVRQPSPAPSFAPGAPPPNMHQPVDPTGYQPNALGLPPLQPESQSPRQPQPQHPYGGPSPASGPAGGASSHSMPPANTTQRPPVAPQPHTGPSHGGAAPTPANLGSSAGGPVVVHPKPGMDKLSSMMESERLAKHALSALRYVCRCVCVVYST